MRYWHSSAFRDLEKRCRSIEKRLGRIQKELDAHNERKKQRERYLNVLFKTLLPVLIAAITAFTAAGVIRPF